ncbi:MAG: 3-oxoacyl-[acyl-carrier-protein] reductase [Erysipelotrichaceae bacterium]|nr:3-oxoacyl-[acyl-carrier-protein] reductase [Erysipelotrichaceae bacterium]MDP3305564.1 3-oxoacyl-[acyl-carrier-protein] reductase [Erysipelotrichaceae bacterium]
MSNLTVLVTGGASGIGKACALTFAQAGYNVVVNYGHSEQAAIDVTKQCSELGVEAFAVKADVSKKDEVDAMVDLTLKTFGSIDVLINNSGITKDNLLLRMTSEDFSDVLDVNLLGTFHCIKSVVKPMMKARKGKIINMASVIGQIGNVGQANYAASKGGIIALTKSVARELASRNVTCNAIAPGFIQTKMTDVLSDEVKSGILGQVPLARLGQPEEVAKVALFLASDAANYITGQVINVDGGMVM